jgi:hypothetical protein
LARAAMAAATNLFVGEFDEPTFDEVEPGRAGGREVHVEPGMPSQPTEDRGCLVGGIVVQDEMHVEVSWHGAVDGVEEGSELAGSMPAVTFSDDGPGFDTGKTPRLPEGETPPWCREASIRNGSLRKRVSFSGSGFAAGSVDCEHAPRMPIAAMLQNRRSVGRGLPIRDSRGAVLMPMVLPGRGRHGRVNQHEAVGALCGSRGVVRNGGRRRWPPDA